MTDKTNRLNFQYIDPKLLVPNPWNSNVMSRENEAKLTESLKRNEMFDAVIARELDDGTYQILGGEHRTKIATKLKKKEIPVIVLQNISDNRAREISLAHNARYGSDDSLKLSELFNSLEDSKILANILPYSEIEIDTWMSATKIDLDLLVPLDDDDLGEPQKPEPTSAPKTHTIMRFKVPIEDAAQIEDIIKNVIKVNGFKDSDSLTNAGDALVHILIGAM